MDYMLPLRLDRAHIDVDARGAPCRRVRRPQLQIRPFGLISKGSTRRAAVAPLVECDSQLRPFADEDAICIAERTCRFYAPRVAGRRRRGGGDMDGAPRAERADEKIGEACKQAENTIVDRGEQRRGGEAKAGRVPSTDR